jgi:chromosome segregation ATPase
MAKEIQKSANGDDAFGFHYINGGAKMKAPAIPRDVVLTAATQERCKLALQRVAGLPAKISNQTQREAVEPVLKDLHDVRDKLKKAIDEYTASYQQIISMHKVAAQELLSKLEKAISDIKDQIARWKYLIEQGRQAELRRAEEEAADHRAAARLETNEVRKRKLMNEAEEFDSVVAKLQKPERAQGAAKTGYWRRKSTDNIQLLAKRNPELACADDEAIDDVCKRWQKEGKTITENSIPGITLEFVPKISYRG